mmetsp:Transcript_51560/g.112310  ORF Transcript_51560/g.112310 Transcript_51560/m.112310 type:complete len:243 (+) Transcript_51560:134-862(+)
MARCHINIVVLRGLPHARDTVACERQVARLLGGNLCVSHLGAHLLHSLDESRAHFFSHFDFTRDFLHHPRWIREASDIVITIVAWINFWIPKAREKNSLIQDPPASHQNAVVLHAQHATGGHRLLENFTPRSHGEDHDICGDLMTVDHNTDNVSSGITLLVAESFHNSFYKFGALLFAMAPHSITQLLGVDLCDGALVPHEATPSHAQVSPLQVFQLGTGGLCTCSVHRHTLAFQSTVRTQR